MEYEKAHSLELPEDYRSFLLETNGGIPSQENAAIPCKLHDGTDSYYPILRFFSVNKLDIWHDLARVNHRLNQSDGDRIAILPNCLAIASIDLGGHEFLGISLAAEKYGYIYVWDYSYAFYDHAVKVADSFADLLNLLCDGADLDE